MQLLTRRDRVIAVLDKTLRTLGGGHVAVRPMPTPPVPASDLGLTADERALSAALMRVNHVGEVCAQALYSAQAMRTRDPGLQQHFKDAARDESDHLAWTERRIAELGGRTSWLNPLWYAGAFGIGWLAGGRGEAASLGFVVETERQVERHLASHLDRLPATDDRSRAIVERMRDDEAKHAADAEHAGAAAVPSIIAAAMRGVAKVMTVTAHRI